MLNARFTKCNCQASGFNKEASWLYAELLQIMCSEEEMSNNILFTYIYSSSRSRAEGPWPPWTFKN